MENNFIYINPHNFDSIALKQFYKLTIRNFSFIFPMVVVINVSIYIRI